MSLSYIVQDDRGSPFDDSYRGLDDGATSEEEIDNGARNQLTSPFPPLVEVRPGD